MDEKKILTSNTTLSSMDIYLDVGAAFIPGNKYSEYLRADKFSATCAPAVLCLAALTSSLKFT